MTPARFNPLLRQLQARVYYLTWFMANHPALNESDAAAMARTVASLNAACARMLGA